MKSKSFLCVYTAVDLLAIFERYSVVRVYPQNEGQMEALVQMQDNPHLDFWTEIGLNRPVDIMVTPFMKSITRQLESHGMKVSTMIQDVESLIEAVKTYLRFSKVPPHLYEMLQLGTTHCYIFAQVETSFTME